jgi:hypothetical protein
MIEKYLDPVMKYVGIGLNWFRLNVQYFDLIFLAIAFFLGYKIVKKFTTSPFSKGFFPYLILISVIIYLLLMYV